MTAHNCSLCGKESDTSRFHSLHFRPLSLDDVDGILTWVNNPAIIGNIATFDREIFTREDEVAYVKKMQESKDDKVFSIYNGEHYVGQIGIHQIYHRARTGRLSIVIASKHDMGKGFGSWAISQILSYAFDSKWGLGLNKIWLMVFEDNERSRRTYERIGFVQEGLLRQEYFHKGEFHNMIRMAVLRDEWKNETKDA